MSDVYYEMEPRMNQTANAEARSTRQYNKRVIRTALLLLWVVVAVGAFALAFFYVGGIQKQLLHIQQTNAAHITEVNHKLTALQNALNANIKQAEIMKQQFISVETELNAVKDAMSLAGDSLTTTAKTRQALNERITELSKELEELRKSIKKLEEAARVY